jgi:small-conductance mechanosensitive channel
MQQVGTSVVTTTGAVVNNILAFIPSFISGLVILLIGWAVASFLKMVVKKGLMMLNPEKYLNKAGFEKENTLYKWPDLIANIVYWFTFLTFLIPAFNAWQLPMITTILSQFLLYIPNVIAAVIIGFVGMILANLAFQVTRNATQEMGSKSSVVLAKTAKYSIIVLTVLMALNQLGVGTNIISILMAGFVLLIAIAGGLAFGLGGQETAKTVLQQVMNNRTAKSRRLRPMAYSQQIRRSKGPVTKEVSKKSTDTDS